MDSDLEADLVSSEGAEEREKQAAADKEQRKEERVQRLLEKLMGFDDKKKTPGFVDTFFASCYGQEFHAQHPPEYPSEEVLVRMQ